MCAVACGGEVGGVEVFSRGACCSSKCCSPTDGGGLLFCPAAFWKQVVPSELRGGSVPLVEAGVSSGAPLQCIVVCLLTMAERVKLFPQVPQVYGFSPVWERMCRCRSPEPMKLFPAMNQTVL